MSAPEFDHYKIELGDDVKVTYIGRTKAHDALKHPQGWVFVVDGDDTWMRTDHQPVWTKIKGKPDSITVTQPVDEGEENAKS